MPQHGGQARFVEYMCSDSTLGFLIRDVLPLAAEHLHLLPLEENSGAYGILGASMGGLMALYSGLRLPDVFGKVISQSGAFGFDLESSESVIYDLVRNYEQRPIKIWMDVGRYEWLLPMNRKMHGLLDAQGYTPIYREYSGGHNYTSWRNEVVLALEALFAP
jgi:enterochelin esterase family protein